MKQKFRKGDTVVTLYHDNVDSKVEIIDVIRIDDFVYLVKDKDGIIQGFKDYEIGLISRGYEWKMVQELLKSIAVDMVSVSNDDQLTWIKMVQAVKILEDHGYEDENIF